jgi:putative glutamine amidotransferase
MALGITYLQAIERAGGLPVVLPPLPPESVAPLLDRLDGVCLSGGPDLDPDAYGARARHAELGPTEPALDAFELELVLLADARGLPILGVCRGAQTMNVARGGTLHQHVANHRQAQLATVPTHEVTLALHSRIERIVGCTRLDVNSFHHQAVARLGAGLAVAGRADDGTVEAIEDRSRRFFVGVQWHAETLVDLPAHRELFRALVKVAGESSGRDLLAA